MCIACELGYWTMIDALEADRASRNDVVPEADARFACEPEVTAEPREPPAVEHTPQPVDEMSRRRD